MDRSRPSAPQRSTAVRTAGRAALDLLLPAAAGKRGEPAPDAKAGPVVHEAPVFRQPQDGRRVTGASRSEEHTSELQSHSDLVCRLLLEKKKKKRTNTKREENTQYRITHTPAII